MRHLVENSQVEQLEQELFNLMSSESFLRVEMQEGEFWTSVWCDEMDDELVENVVENLV